MPLPACSRIVSTREVKVSSTRPLPSSSEPSCSRNADSSSMMSGKNLWQFSRFPPQLAGFARAVRTAAVQEVAAPGKRSTPGSKYWFPKPLQMLSQQLAEREGRLFVPPSGLREIDLLDVQSASVAAPTAEEKSSLDEGSQSSGDEREEGERKGMILLFRGRRQKEPEPPLPVKESHPALQLALQRARTGSKPGQRTDGFKLGLVVEGGGMRGAVSAGGLQSLHDLGLREVFDAVYGSSAGAINGSFFLSGQREGVDIYTQEIANKQFVDLSRLVRKAPDSRPALDLEFLLDHVMEEKRPLDWEAVLDSPIPLKVVASCLDTLQPVLLENFESKEDLRTCLKASANVPEVAGGPLHHRGQRLVDAAVFQPIPFQAAIADGCTHVLVLCSKPPFRGGRLRKAVDDIFTLAVKRSVLNPAYMREAWKAELDMLAADGMSSDEMLLLGLEAENCPLPFFNGAFVYPIFPGPKSRFSPLSIDVPQLAAGILEGRAAVARTFASFASIFPRVEQPVQPAGDAAASSVSPLPAPMQQPQEEGTLVQA